MADGSKESRKTITIHMLKNKILTDFSDGMINVGCTVDMFNEGLDVPDVNILVFQRVTHSRRIFIQQLGRGLRKYKDKQYVTVLDFIGNSYKKLFYVKNI